MFRVEGNGPAMLGHRLVPLALRPQRVAQIMVGLGVRGSDRDELAVQRDRLVRLAAPSQRVAEHPARMLPTGVDLDRMTEGSDRLVEFAVQLEGLAEMDVERGVLGVEGD